MQLKYHIITIEDLMPQKHFLRQLEAVLDLSFVYGETAHLYSRPPIDPVVLVKYLLVGFLYAIPSERQIDQRVQVEKGLLNGHLVVTDSTHVKANASRASEYEVDAEEGAGNYWERLDAYEEEGLEEVKRRTGKRRAKRTKQVKKGKRRSHKRMIHPAPDTGL